MSAPRFYLDIETALLDEALSTATPVTLTADAAHHAGRALRLRTGEGVSIFNGAVSSPLVKKVPPWRSLNL